MDKDVIVTKRPISVDEWYKCSVQGLNIPVTIPVYGKSMEPLIRMRKDYVTICPINSLEHSIEVGDIVLFRRKDGAFVLHRLYRKIEDEQKVITWGDNCLAPDCPICMSDVLGVAISVQKGKRNIPLYNVEQREYGVRWMNGSLKRRLWFGCKKIYSLPREVWRKLKRVVGV